MVMKKFGVGGDVDMDFLRKLSGENHGYETYIERSEDIESIVTKFLEKVSRPVLTDISLDFGGLGVYDTYPVELPDLFAGTQLVQVGRYKGPGGYTVTLRGKFGAVPQEYTYQADFPEEETSNPFVPRLWAATKIDHLLKEIAMFGELRELVDAVIALSLTYTIVTPYTSYLVLEPEFEEPLLSVEEEQGRQSTISGKTFFLQNGLWVDSEYSPSLPVVEVKFDTEEFLYLLKENPDVMEYLKLGRNIIVVIDGKQYKLIADPSDFILFQNSPNPFNSSTTIGFYIFSPGTIELTVYNLLGQKVRTLFAGRIQSGEHRVTWDGKDEWGRDMSSGVYLCRLTADRSRQQMRRMLLLR